MKEVVSKLKFKKEGIVLHAPAALEKEFLQLGFTNQLDSKTKSDNTLVFVNNEKELVAFLSKQLKYIEPDSVLWIAYPKGTSGIKTDIHRDTIRTKVEEFDITTVSAISINETWSALRMRPTDKVGKK
ncbi:MAG TPA: hypothetical protein VK750_09650 [Cytophagaceae bacterium]|jgi:hypothetical protein|nr:hypothetical protein [Cytophagaceae bacterium]